MKPCSPWLPLWSFQGNQNIVVELAPFSRLERDCLHHYRRVGRPCPVIGNRGADTGRRGEKGEARTTWYGIMYTILPLFSDSITFVYRNENWKATPVDLPIRRRRPHLPCDSPDFDCPTSGFHLLSLIPCTPMNDHDNHVRQIHFFR